MYDESQPSLLSLTSSQENTMANQWFKFYGGEYLSDPKVLVLSASERSCWITLMCYASVTDNGGVINHLDEKILMIQAGVPADNDEWERTKGVLKKFESLGMIVTRDNKIQLKNWKKRQETMLTGAERSRRYREKQRDEGDSSVTQPRDESNARREENRIDKKRIEEKREYLRRVPQKDMDEFTKRFIASEKEIKGKAEDLELYCQRKGRTYKNYKALLLNALKRDFKERGEKGGKYAQLS